MYNFLDPKLLPKVSTTAACVEGYEVTNLISSNPMVKSRGFLCFTSIKPPIEVDFELICPISLHYITISTTLGNQKSIGVEILARNNQTEYTPIAQRFYEEAGVTFCNLRYYSHERHPNNTNNTFYLGYFKKNVFRVFINTNKIKVRILRTERSVPCIASIEIWGTVSKSCSKTTLDTISKIMTEKTIAAPLMKFTEDESNLAFEIPDDFKDALTFEIMAIPMTLPSGHTVDQTTLEKCVMNDASYGRQNCDPFTGLCFTDSRKPKLNTALKSRIDMFLISNAHREETYNLSRTSGRKVDDVINKSAAVLKEVGGVSGGVDYSCMGSGKDINNYTMKSKKNIVKASNKIKSRQTINGKVFHSINHDVDNCSINSHTIKVGYIKDNCSVNGHIIDNSTVNRYTMKSRIMDNFTVNTHTTNKQYSKDEYGSGGSSLEDAMAKAINNSNFICFTKDEATENKECDKIMCSNCNSSDNLYSLKCNHLYCRSCLLSVCKTLICTVCDKQFNRDDVEKFHV